MAKLQSSIFNIRYSIFILLFACLPLVVHSQPLQQIHSNLNRATSLYVTQNSIYVVEQGQHRLLKLAHNGKVQETIGGRGSGNYAFSRPVDVHATNGLKIFVSDYNNRRIQIFDRRGQYLSSISGGSYFDNRRSYEPTQLAVNNLGELFFYDENTSALIHFDMDFAPLDAFRLPSEVGSVDDIKLNERRFFILDKPAGVIHELERNGAYRSFYEAEITGAFFVQGTTIWKAGRKGLTMLEQGKEPRSFTFTEVLQPVGLHVLDGIAYILTADALYTWSLR